MKITPVLVVDEIEKSLPFWVDRLGFTRVAEVPDEGRLGFVMLVGDGADLMLQTRRSVEQDVPQFAPIGSTQTSLFIVVDKLDEVARKLEGYPIAMPERTTFYGMREIGVFDPANHIVIFAEQMKTD
jgi:uncharacterized glyoxalase superfamily protein PhnB